MPDNVLLTEAHELDPLHLAEDVRNHDQAGVLLARQVDLRDVAGNDHLRVEPQPRQEHLHLLGTRVLGFVEDHERVVQRAPAHERQRSDLDDAAIEVLVHALGVEHVVERVEQRPQVRVHLGHQVAREEAEPLARLDRRPRQDDPADLAPRQRRHRHRHRQERLAGPGGADADGDRLVADRVHVALLVDRLRRDRLAPVPPDDVLEDRARALVVVERVGDRLDRAGCDLVALADEVGELAHDRLGDLDLRLAAVERQDVPAQEDLAVEVTLERPHDGVARARKLARDFVWQLQLGAHATR